MTDTDRDREDLILVMLEDIKQEQVKTRTSLHELRTTVDADRLSAALARKDFEFMTRRLEAVEREQRRRVTLPVPTTEGRSRAAQASYVGGGVAVLAVIVKVVEFIGAETWHAVAKAVMK